MPSYSYEASSELLKHYSPDIHHGPSHNLAAVYDEDKRPLVFTIANASYKPLCVTVADRSTKKNITFNLSEAFGLSGQEVNFIAANQDEAQNIYLAFTTKDIQDPARYSILHVCAPTRPDAWRHPEKISAYKLHAYDNGAKFQSVQDVFFAPNVILDTDVTGKYGPFLAVHYAENADVRVDRIFYNRQNWFLRRDQLKFELPYPTPEILDKAVLVVRQAVLITVILHRYQGQAFMKMRFRDLRVGADRSWVTAPIPLAFPATCLGTCLNSGSYQSNDLLFAADGLYFLGPNDLYARFEGNITYPPQKLKLSDGTDDAFFCNVQDMVTVQSGDLVSVFVRTGDPRICNSMIRTGDKPSIERRTVPICAGDLIDFSPIFHNPTESHHFMMLNSKQQHLVLQFKPLSSTWEETFYMIDVAGANADLPKYSETVSYHTHIIVKKDGQPAPGESIALRASEVVSVTINGVDTQLGTFAVPVTTDLRGCLSIVSPVDSIGSIAVFTLQAGGRQIGDPVNPASKIDAGLAGIDSGAALREAVLKTDGKTPVVPLNDLSITDDAIETAATNICALHRQLNYVNSDGSVTGARGQSLFSEGWAAFHFVEKSAQAVIGDIKTEGEKGFERLVSITIHVVEDVTHVLEMAVDSIARALKAISYVLNTLKVDLERIHDWLAMLFRWTEIKAVKDSMAACTRQFFGQSKEWVPALKDEIKTCLSTAFLSFDHMLDHMMSTALLNDTTDGSLSSILAAGAPEQTANADGKVPTEGLNVVKKGKTSPGAQWTTNQAASGNLTSSATASTMSIATTKYCFQQEWNVHSTNHGVLTVVKGSYLASYSIVFPAAPKIQTDFAPMSAEKMDALDDLWNKLEGFLGDLMKDFELLGENLLEILSGKLEPIGVQLMDTFAKFLKKVLNVFQNAIDAFLDAIGDLIGDLLDCVLQGQLGIPFIEAMWKVFGDSQEMPRLLDIGLILLAIPTTAMAELIVPEGQPIWPDLTNWTNGSNFAKLGVENTDVKAFVGKMEQLLQIQPQARGHEARDPKHPYHRATTKVRQSHDAIRESDWLRYTHGEIVAHPTVTLLEAFLNAARANIAAPIPGWSNLTTDARKPLDFISIAIELAALAFSIPNLEGFEFGDIGHDATASASFCEILGTVCRLADVIIEIVLFRLEYRPGPNPDTRPIQLISKVICTACEFVCGICASCFRRREHGIDDVEQIAAGLAIGNACSSLCEQVCAIVAEHTAGEVKAGFLIAAAAFAVCDTGLDAGRGGYEWARAKSAAKIKDIGVNGIGTGITGTHVVAFGTAQDGSNDAEIMDDHSGTHQIVTY